MGRSRLEATAKFPLGTLILKPQTPTKCTLGSSFVEKTLTLVEIKPLQLLPTASFMGWYEVCLSLRRVLGPTVPCGRAARCICWLCSRSGVCVPSTPNHLLSQLLMECC